MATPVKNKFRKLTIRAGAPRKAGRANGATADAKRASPIPRLLRKRAAEVMEQKYDFMDSEHYSRPRIEQELFEDKIPPLPLVAWYQPTRDDAFEADAVVGSPQLMKPAEEKLMFLRFNFAKKKLGVIQRRQPALINRLRLSSVRRAVYRGDHKLTTVGGRAEGLFDLAADPAESHNLTSDQAALVSDLGRKLATFVTAAESHRAEAAFARSGSGCSQRAASRIRVAIARASVTANTGTRDMNRPMSSSENTTSRVGPSLEIPRRSRCPVSVVSAPNERPATSRSPSVVRSAPSCTA